MGGSWDATNVADARGRGGAADRRRPRAATSATPPADDRASRRPASSSPARSRSLAEQAPEVAAVLLERGRRGRRDRRPRGHGLRRRRPDARGRRPDAVAAGPARSLRRRLPAALRRPPGAERRGRAGRGRGLRRRATQPLDEERRPRGLRRGHLAGPARDRPAQPHGRARRRPQPARRRGARRGARGLLHVQPADRRDRRDGRQGPRGRCSSALEPHLAHVVCTQNSTDRALPAERAGRDRARGLRRGPGLASRRGLADAIDAGRRRWPRPARPSATRSAPARCWSPARSSPSARPARLLVRADDRRAAGSQQTAAERSPRRGMCAAVLSLEAITLGLTTPVMITIADVDAATALVDRPRARGGLPAARRHAPRRVGLRRSAGSIQVAAIALGFVIPLMFVLGGDLRAAVGLGVLPRAARSSASGPRRSRRSTRSDGRAPDQSE